ncbi:LysR family transcriptional regulator [Myxococcus faecalis]|uniref:LysR family transcriptional regulator n=1 Tax=Myxococcus faecalis TaxID=3115646 RepID=UPI003CEDFDC5
MHSLANIDAFVRVVEEGDFTRAARKLHLTASAVSRRISRLEEELGMKLFQRTTRALRLTEDGRDFHARCQRILTELGEAKESLTRARVRPSGVLRVEAPQVIGQLVLVPALPRFLARYPDLTLHLTLRDEVMDPVAGGADVHLRLGALEDSTLVARKLTEARLLACASPRYLERRGTPTTPEELARHDCLGFMRDGKPLPWLLRQDGAEVSLEPRASLHVNHGGALRDAAMLGLGIAWLFDFMVARDLASGALVEVLAPHTTQTRAIHVLHPPDRHLPSRTRVFLDFVATLFPRAPY